MADKGNKIGSALQSHARTRGPIDGKLFIKPTGGIGNANEGNIYLYLRMVADARLVRDEDDPIVREESRKGKLVQMENFYPRRSMRLQFRLRELFEPYTLGMALGDDNDATTGEENTVTNYFAMTLHGEKVYDLPYEFNLPESLPNAAQTVTGTPFEGDGSIPNSTVKYFVAAKSGGVESGLSATATSAEVTFAASDDTCQVSWALVAGQPEPDSWVIYRDTTAYDFTTPAKIAEVDGSVYSMIDTLASPTTGGAGTGAITLIVKSADEATTYVENDDYIVDYTEGTLQRVESGDIGNGELVVITLRYIHESFVEFTLDEGTFNSRTFAVMILGQNAGTRGYIAGRRMELHAVDFARGSEQYNLMTMLDDGDGHEFDLPVLFSAEHAGYGTERVFDEYIDDHVVLTLT